MYCKVFFVEKVAIRSFLINLISLIIELGASVNGEIEIFEIASVLKIILPSTERFLEFHKQRTFCIFLIVTKTFFRI